MRCVVCREEVKTQIDDHVDLHLPVGQDQILGYFKELAAPFKVRLYRATGADVERNEILFSLENAKLFIGYAERHHHIPWEECCEWMALHEKAHITLSDLYPYYLTYASWYASDVVSLTEANLPQPEIKIVETVARSIKELKTPEELSPTISLINGLLRRLVGSQA